ncbi:MAG TPA: hypothetical protein VEL72_05385 [Ktedonobacteraceae bacterium]|nr:hypothetical protein [Ktedonobacteraceae bacterium]
MSGINGSALGYVAHLEIGVHDHYIPVPVVFSFEFSPVGFGGIIGQVGFFDAFKIQFDRAIKEVHLIVPTFRSIDELIEYLEEENSEQKMQSLIFEKVLLETAECGLPACYNTANFH